jgi:hypothetical protein
MANVAAKVIGGRLSTFDADCIADLKNKMGLTGNYTAQVNGEPVGEDCSDLADDDLVTFTQSVKGGNNR